MYNNMLEESKAVCVSLRTGGDREATKQYARLMELLQKLQVSVSPLFGMNSKKNFVKTPACT